MGFSVCSCEKLLAHNNKWAGLRGVVFGVWGLGLVLGWLLAVPVVASLCGLFWWGSALLRFFLYPPSIYMTNAEARIWRVRVCCRNLKMRAQLLMWIIIFCAFAEG